MHSPQRFSLQSRNLPVISLTCVSLTMMVQVPIPDSPLKPVRIAWETKVGSLPMSHRHKCPVFIATSEGIVCPCSSDMADYPFRASKFDTQITSPGVIHIHCDSHVFEALQICLP